MHCFFSEAQLHFGVTSLLPAAYRWHVSDDCCRDCPVCVWVCAFLGPFSQCLRLVLLRLVYPPYACAEAMSATMVLELCSQRDELQRHHTGAPIVYRYVFTLVCGWWCSLLHATLPASSYSAAKQRCCCCCCCCTPAAVVLCYELLLLCVHVGHRWRCSCTAMGVRLGPKCAQPAWL